MPAAERTFRAMGSDCHVVAVADDVDAARDFAELAIERVELLEQAWSRFRASSELSHLNLAAGSGPIAVSPDVFLLVSHMAQAWSETGGRFDPTILASLVALGYDEDFTAVAERTFATSIDGIGTAPGMSGVMLDPTALTVDLPAGVGLDPGAIGKGLGADLVADELTRAGASGVLVNLGGDLAFAGHAENDQPWAIGVEDERRAIAHPDRLLRVVEFSTDSVTTGVATSTTLKRRWAQGRRHHVIDPRTGSMSVSDLVQVTIVADRAWRAEVLATTALLMSADDAAVWLRAVNVPAILLTADRAIIAMEEAA